MRDFGVLCNKLRSEKTPSCRRGKDRDTALNVGLMSDSYESAVTSSVAAFFHPLTVTNQWHEPLV
jgi:hypothetical protein